MKTQSRFKYFVLTCILLVVSILVPQILFSQDILLKHNKEEIRVKIYEIEDVKIKYKLFDNLNGPTYSINRTDVFMITYENGSMDVFSSDGSFKSIQPKSVLGAYSTPPPPQNPEQEQQKTIAKPIESKVPAPPKGNPSAAFFLSYSASLDAPLGFQIGALANRIGDIGFYSGMKLSGNDFQGLNNNATCDDYGFKDGSAYSDYEFSGYEMIDRFSVTFGVNGKMASHWHSYYGLGYGYKKYWHLYDVYSKNSNSTSQEWANHESWDIEGLEFEFGLILQLGHFNMQTGLTSINISDYYNWTFGAGFSF